MKQVFIVMEGNGESYEDYHEVHVAAFSNEEDAVAHAKVLQEEYDKIQELGANEQEDYQKEEYSMTDAIPYNWIDDSVEYYNIFDEVYKYLQVKYPNAVQVDYTKHSFFVSEPIPFIK